MYIRYNTQEELTRAAAGKKTKVPVRWLLYDALASYPHIQTQVGKLYGISEG